MFSKIILCVTNDKLTAGVWRLGKMLSYQVYENNEQGHQDFKLFLEKNPNVAIYMLVDALEEDYRLETLPHTFGDARKQLIDRKLNQIYRGTEYRTAHFINREKDKRKDDRFLLAALNNPDFFKEWLIVIDAVQAPLVGVYLLPMVSQIIVRRNKIMSPHIILSERLNSGLRQSYLHNGRLRMSRLATVTPDMENRLGFFYLMETEKTRLYLMSQRFVTRETPIQLVLPALDQDAAMSVGRNIEQEHGISASTIDLGKFAISHGVDPRLLVINPELLHMQLLAKGHVPDNLAPASASKYHQVHFIRQSINGAAAVVMLGGLSLAGYNLQEAAASKEKLSQATQSRQQQDILYANAAKDFPDTPIPAADLKNISDLYEAIKANIKSPERMMQIISKSVDEVPEIQINRLRWALSSDINLKDDDKPGAVVAQPTQNINQPVSTFVPDPTTLYEVVFMNGEIRNFNGDYRSALASVNRFADLLRADKQIEQVIVIQAPVNVSSFSNLQGSTTDEESRQQQAALFKIKLILKREVPPA